MKVPDDRQFGRGNLPAVDQLNTTLRKVLPDTKAYPVEQFTIGQAVQIIRAKSDTGFE